MKWCSSFILLFHINICADVSGLNGIHFDIDDNETFEAILNETGLGLGTNLPAANLHVIGDGKISGGSLTIGTGTISHSNLNLHGTLSLGVTTHSSDFSMIYDQILSNKNSDSAEEEVVATTVRLASSDLELLYDSGDSVQQVVGLRFEIPHASAANISDAYIQFEADETDSASISLEIRGELNANSPTFTDSNGNISIRSRTSAMVNWNSIDAWENMNEQTSAQVTPSVLSIVSEIMGLPQWSANNGMSFIFENGSGGAKRVAEPSQSGDASPTLFLLQSSKSSIHLCDTSSGDLNFELAPASMMDGQIYTIKKVSPNNTLIISTHACSIDDAPVFVMGSGKLASINIFSNGQNWYIIDTNGSLPTILATAIASDSDDAEEILTTNSISLNSSDLEMYSNSAAKDQKIGLRFTGVNIPAGSSIKSAWVQFASDKDDGDSNNDNPSLLIEVASNMNLGTFTTAASNISGIATLSSNATWTPSTTWKDGGYVGIDQRTCDFKSVVQALIDQSGWASSNKNIVVIISQDASDSSTNGRRGASSKNEGDYPPTLFIVYE